MNPARRLLRTLGATGARGLALSLFAGLATPGLGVWLKPTLPFLVGLFVALAFARLDLAVVGRLLRAPGKVALTVLWLALSLPLAVWAMLNLLGRASLDPGLVLGLSLQAASAPILATPAVAMLLGLDGAFALVALTTHMAILPLIAPALAAFVAGDAVPLDGWAIARNLALLMAGASLAAGLARRRWSLDDIRAAKPELDGLNLILFFLFALAIMEGVAARAWREPGLVALHVGVAFALGVAGLAAGALALRALLPAGDALVIGYATGHRNAGLMVAAMGGVLPDQTWLFFACLQGPIYMTPMLIGWLARRRTGPD